MAAARRGGLRRGSSSSHGGGGATISLCRRLCRRLGLGLLAVAADGDAVDLLVRLAPSRVVVVADAGLGVINALGLSLAPLRDHGYDPMVVLNRFDEHDDLHRRNAQWLRDQGVDPLVSVAALVTEIEQEI